MALVAVCGFHRNLGTGKSLSFVRVSPDLKREVEAAADYLDMSLSQVVRDSFKSLIEKAHIQMLRQEDFRRRFAEYGVEGLPMTPKQEVEAQMHGVDTRLLSKQQRKSLERASGAGKLAEKKPLPNFERAKASPGQHAQRLAYINQLEASGTMGAEEIAMLRDALGRE